MTDIKRFAILRAEAGIRAAIEVYTLALKAAFAGDIVETTVGRHTVRGKVVDAEDGKLVLESGIRREWRRVELVAICDRQEMAQRHEVGARQATP
jgi:hypothetical protein